MPKRFEPEMRLRRPLRNGDGAEGRAVIQKTYKLQRLAKEIGERSRHDSEKVGRWVHNFEKDFLNGTSPTPRPSAVSASPVLRQIYVQKSPPPLS
jgi:hypothetical protein